MAHILSILVLEGREHPSSFAIAVIKHWLKATYLVYTCITVHQREDREASKTGSWRQGLKQRLGGVMLTGSFHFLYSPLLPAYGSCCS